MTPTPPNLAPTGALPPFWIAMLRSFFIIPTWDAQALYQSLKTDARQQIVRQLAVTGGALILALVGIGILRLTQGAACCQSVGPAIAPRVLPSVGMLFFIALGGWLTTLTLVSTRVFLQKKFTQQSILSDLISGIWEVGTAGLSSPVGHLAVLVLLILGARLGALPLSAGQRWYGVIVPGLLVGLMPGWIASKRVLRTYSDPVGEHRYPAVLLAGTAYYQQCGWLLGGLIATETIFGVNGLGALFATALDVVDFSLIIPLLLMFLLAILLCRIHVIRLDSVRRALYPAQQNTGTKPPPVPLAHWMKLIAAVTMQVVPLIVSLAWQADSPIQTDINTIYVSPSPAHPFGTDYFGRDVQEQLAGAIINSWLTVIVGSIVAVGFGGLWSLGIKRPKRRFFKDLVELPAVALILFSSALVALWLFTSIFPPAGQRWPVLALGVLGGLTLIPRAAWGLSRYPDPILPTANRWLSFGLTASATLLTMFHLTVMLTLLDHGAQPPFLHLGSMLSRYEEILAGTDMVGRAYYFRMAFVISLPAISTGWGSGLLYDTLADVSGCGDDVAALLAG